MQSSNSSVNNRKRVRGWIFDVYPSDIGKMVVWIIKENGERVRFTDNFKPKIYISGKKEDLQRLTNRFLSDLVIASWKFIYKYAHPEDAEKSIVLEVTLTDCRKIPAFTQRTLKEGEYLRYEISNCDLNGDRAYLFSQNLFPLAFVDVETEKGNLRYKLLDSVESVDYTTPSLRRMKLQVDIAKKGKIANFKDPIERISLSQEERQIAIDKGAEEEKLLKLVEAIRALDPDVVLTTGGDAYFFPYLIHRAKINNVLNKFILSRDNVVFTPKSPHGRTFFSYGRTFYRAPTTRLYGRIHIDEYSTFVLSEADFDGLIEIARTCRVPLHTASRSSIGSSMASLQCFQAIKDEMLIPRNKSIPEPFQSAYELLVGDRGGSVYEPQVGIHDAVGEIDFASMYPSLMVNNNISIETVSCGCCANSNIRIPELKYNICEKRTGVVSKALSLIVSKRLLYKNRRDQTEDPKLRDIYDKRQAALKWILVTCFGYLGYKNAKFGTVTGHIGVCSFGRDTFLRAAKIAENQGFMVIHGIVDSLWLKKKDATTQEYRALCRKISKEVGVPLNFEGLYKWIVFLPSKMHPRIGVLNRYYGVMTNGKIKVRGIEVRRRDTPRFIYSAQMEMIKRLSTADDAEQFIQKIPEALQPIKNYRQRLIDDEIPTSDLIVTKHLSKNPKKYKQRVSQVIAAEQLMKEGFEIHAGKNIQFLFKDAENKRYTRRVQAEQLADTNTNTDTKKYLSLLYASAASLLSVVGYTTQSVQDSARGYTLEHTNLENFLGK